MVRVFSFCLYGPETPYYYRGMLENLELIQKHFPDWKVYIYLGIDVPDHTRERLASYPSVVLRETGITGPKTMVHRFFAIDEPEVELMLVRDADSRVHWKDRWAIREFLRQSQFTGHSIRDNVVHKIELCGGLWGMRKIPEVSIRALHDQYAAEYIGSGQLRVNGYDQDFLKLYVYPHLAARGLLIHYSNKCLLNGERGVEFPFGWSNETFCGRGEVGVFIDVPEPPRPTKTILDRLPRGTLSLTK
jgi:hypothetical protein